jgi:hypothetical protein
MLRSKDPFEGIGMTFPEAPNEGDTMAEDIRAGFLIYSVTVMCQVEALKLHKFLESLVSIQIPRTIIQATVNTIHQEKMKYSNRKLIGKFYQKLNDVFNFQHGRILVAMSTPAELEAMLFQDLPYLTPYRELIMECIKKGNCEGVTDLLKQLGA